MKILIIIALVFAGLTLFYLLAKVFDWWLDKMDDLSDWIIEKLSKK